jgi:hypothetical protein
VSFGHRVDYNERTGSIDPTFLTPNSARIEAKFESSFGLSASLVVDAAVITKEKHMTVNTRTVSIVPHTSGQGSVGARAGSVTAAAGQQTTVCDDDSGWVFGLSARAWFKKAMWSIWLVACLSRSPVGEELQPKLKDGFACV